MDENEENSRSCAGTKKHNWQAIPRALAAKRPAPERIRDFNEIYEAVTAEEIREQASRCVQCGQPLCITACPLKNRIPEWVALAAEGLFLEAAELSRETSNMPEICSRVCPQELLCEGACVLNSRSAPVTIGIIEKFINDYAALNGSAAKQPRPNGFRVAVIGAGPAGLSCADELAEAGCAVTVFEANEGAGGLLVYGIPSFKLEKSVVDRRVALLRKKGIEFRFGRRLGNDFPLSGLLADFDAVFLGFGAQKPKEAGVPGADLPGVHDALPFLVETNLGPRPGAAPTQLAGRRVVVLGGGDTVMDCLRSAIRAGAGEAICVYRRDEANMPGSAKDYKNAIEEGARFEFLTNPVEIIAGTDGRVASLKCVKMRLGEPDSSGRRRPEPIEGSEFLIPADIVLVAFGFDPICFPEGSDLNRLERNKWGGLVLDENRMTNLRGVFGGGDAWRGPSLVSHAVSDGRQAAEGILRYLQTKRPNRELLSFADSV